MKNMLQSPKNLIVLFMIYDFSALHAAETQQLIVRKPFTRNNQRSSRRSEILKTITKYKKLQIQAGASLHDATDYLPSPPSGPSNDNQHTPLINTRQSITIFLPEPRAIIHQPSEPLLDRALTLLHQTQAQTANVAQWALQRLPSQSSLHYVHNRLSALSSNISLTPHLAHLKKYFATPSIRPEDSVEKIPEENRSPTEISPTVTTHDDGLLTLGLPVELPQ